MNKERRGKLLSLTDSLRASISFIEYELGEEQDSYDNLPDGIVDSEKGEKFEECIENLESAISSIEDAIEFISDATA